MAQLLNDIEWGQSILTPISDRSWEGEVKRRAGQVSEVDRRVARSPWVRELCVSVTSLRPAAMPPRLFNIGTLITAQENSCRYCYGANRAYLKILGYSEVFIDRIERDTDFAELDGKERAFIAFCRSLARSRPRPMKADYEALVAQGFAPLAVSEMAMLIALGCYYNRISILIACPPERAFERIANSMLGRVLAPVMRTMMSMHKPPQAAILDAATLSAGPFGSVVATLQGLPGATIFRSGLDSAFASAVLPRAVKALMFVVVARTLGCRRSESEARKLLADEDFSDAEIDEAILTLRSPRLSERDALLLPWVRNTVYYQTAAVQKQTAALAAEIGEAALLEAIGIAALANATVRLAMLLE